MLVIVTFTTFIEVAEGERLAWRFHGRILSDTTYETRDIRYKTRF